MEQTVGNSPTNQMVRKISQQECGCCVAIFDKVPDQWTLCHLHQAAPALKEAAIEVAPLLHLFQFRQAGIILPPISKEKGEIVKKVIQMLDEAIATAEGR